jgi:DNA/RNA-binding domain of Phe-tRNA-synthetase-like protein
MAGRIELTHAPHERLRAHAFITEYATPLGSLPVPSAITTMLVADADAPFNTDETVRAAVRDLLRAGGFKPTGRSKPASEYLARAAYEAGIRSVNAAVDACNAVSLHSGLPISVIDLDLAEPPLHIAIADPDTRYVFNESGQEIDLGGLLCLFDAAGPCANPVKDAQRTKTHEDTVRTLSVVWGCVPFEKRTASAVAWYRSLVEEAGGETEGVAIREQA